MTNNETSTINVNKLVSRYEQYRPIMSLSGTWDIDDIPDHIHKERAIQLLKHCNAIEKVSVKTEPLVLENAPNSKRYVNQWQWINQAKEKIRKNMANKEVLPCPREHRMHIYNDPQTPDGKLGCKYCAEEGFHPVIPKESINL